MKAVILCAGKATRTYPLTIDRPKPLIRVANRTLLEWHLEQLQGLVDEAILVVGFGKAMIKNLIGKKYGRLKVTYVEQKEPLGTGHALLQAEKAAGEQFLVMMGDTLYRRNDIGRCAKRFSLLCMKAENPSVFGVVEKKGSSLVRISEKPERPSTNLVNCALYHLGKDVFTLLKRLQKSERGETELTDAVTSFARDNAVRVIETRQCFMITYPWDLLPLNEFLLAGVKRSVKGRAEKNVTLKGRISVGKGTLLRAGTYIEGPVVIGENCDIGPNCYIRKATSIGDDCRIGNSVEIKNSIIMDGTSIGHHSYAGDSIIDENVNFGAGTKIANLRHDNANVKSMVKGLLLDTRRRKFGSVIGRNVHLGINTSIYPGRKLWPNTSTLPGEIVKYDKESGQGVA
jgi:bifunctional UDP-N-acetylglucosamine pyrophosphorylase/glucosamine-1-phosphate N-acetyltransferase